MIAITIRQSKRWVIPVLLVPTMSWALHGCGEVPVSEDGLKKSEDKKGSESGDTPAGDPADSGTGSGTGSDTIKTDPLTGQQVESTFVNKNCPDGQYKETLPDHGASIASLVSAYNPADAWNFVRQALTIRYPVGLALVDRIATDAQCKQFIDQLGQGSFEDLDFQTILIHECGHLLNAALTPEFGKQGFYLTEATQFQCSSGAMMPRGDILGDQFDGAIAACAEGEGGDCDMYRNTYFTELGDQNFGDLMDEQVEYVHSLAVGYAFNDQRPANQGSSYRDGILAFLWYMQRYLHLARTAQPAEYEKIAGSQCWRELILTNWGRAWLYLEKTAAIPALEIVGPKFLEQVKNPDLLNEVELIRKRHGCSP